VWLRWCQLASSHQPCRLYKIYLDNLILLGGGTRRLEEWNHPSLFVKFSIYNCIYFSNTF
jgi:hypothetical protein